MFDVGATELLVVAALAVMLYGGDLPDVARKAGSTVKRLRGVADDLKRQVTLPPEMQTGFRDVRAELRKLPEDLAQLRPEILGEPATEPPKPAIPPGAPEANPAPDKPLVDGPPPSEPPAPPSPASPT